MMKVPIKYIQKASKKGKDDLKKKIDSIRKVINAIFTHEMIEIDYPIIYEKVVALVRQDYGDKLHKAIEKDFIKNAKRECKNVMKVGEDSFLKTIYSTWVSYRLNVRKSKDILLFLDENYVEKNSTHEKKISGTYKLGIDIFKKEVILKVSDKLRRILLALIEKERNNEMMLDKFLMKNVCEMMVEIDKENVYKKAFETPLLEASKYFFQKEAQKWFENSTAVNYLTKVKKRLFEEKKRCQRCFDVDTEHRLETVIHNEMINKYKEMVVKKEGSGVLIMLQNQKQGELRLVYDVLSLVEGALVPTIQMLKDFIVNEGMQIVNENLSNKKNSQEFVLSILDHRHYYENLLEESFSKTMKDVIIKDKDFSKAVKDAFVILVNKNERFPEYLSLLLDKKLKKGKNQVDDDKSDEFFDKVILTFHHVKEKDIFEKYYKMHLARRLLSGRSSSDDSEKMFLSKLKSSFGYQFTSKLEGMFKDMKISEELNKEWKMVRKKIEKEKSDKRKFELGVQILTHVYWPISTHKKCKLIDNTLNEECVYFEKFYNEKHNGRKISWHYSMGTADIRSNGFNKKYEFNVSTFQMNILILFNNYETDNENGKQQSLTIEKIQEQTGIPLSELKRNIFALCIPSEKGGGKYSRLFFRTTKIITKNTEIKVNKKFKSKKIKVKIQPVVKKEDDDQRRITIRKVDDERKWVIDACVVRIMKMRKQLHHKKLIVEVIEQLQGRFTPTPEIIKRRIESLIDRDYLERSDKDRTLYNYLA